MEDQNAKLAAERAQRMDEASAASAEHGRDQEQIRELSKHVDGMRASLSETQSQLEAWEASEVSEFSEYRGYLYCTIRFSCRRTASFTLLLLHYLRFVQQLSTGAASRTSPSV